MEIDQETGWGSAHHAVLRLGKLPIFYSPYMTFPVDDRRKSGFLFPTCGSSQDLGTEFSIPYYLNLAPELRRDPHAPLDEPARHHARR